MVVGEQCGCTVWQQGGREAWGESRQGGASSSGDQQQPFFFLINLIAG